MNFNQKRASSYGAFFCCTYILKYAVLGQPDGNFFVSSPKMVDVGTAGRQIPCLLAQEQRVPVAKNS
ncbi:hypothetical protein D1B31_11000 [Neobacillus notoginsengisoli]|uniref:Uncharacterized protein n=1 Tax=Neobacillus notoginsengisoli TaxID=1578198 RepID=A0A417YU53_9BACI|nr:hypothetical protein D1B31_11000 [Neobacillus notoginsengisoli]